MSSDFKSQKLREVIELVIDNRGKNPKEYSSTGIPVIDNYLITSDGQVNLDEVNRYIDENTYNSFLRKYIKYGDVLMTLVGNGYGKVAIAPEEKCAIIQNTVGFRCNNDNSNKFLYFLLRNNREIFMNLNRGAAQPSIKVGDILELEFQFPSKKNQEDISSILVALDDRITLLRETNTTLEAIAQALFKSWFVDFDPVRAKSKGKLPEGMDEATAALFPDAFEDTELGMVPKGWQFSTLSSLAAFQNGYAFKGSDWVEQGHPVIKIGNVKPLLIDFDGCSYVSPETVLGLDRFKLGRGDLLVGMTGYVGETGLVTHTEVASYLNQRVGRIATNKGLDDLGFVFAAVRQTEFKAYAESQSHGSAQANVSGTDLMKFSVVIPPAQVLDKFNQVVGNLIEKILANFEEAKTLTNLRDTLLPRLISGQLRIADAEAELEKVTA